MPESKELQIVKFARDKGLLVENLDELEVGQEYMLVPMDIADKEKLCGLFTIAEVGYQGKKIDLFRVEKELWQYRQFFDYWFLKVV